MADFINKSPGPLPLKEEPLHLAKGKVPLASEVIPCCVPYWDSARFLKIGGSYALEHGYYINLSDYRPPFEEWLPRKYQDRGDPPVPVILPDMLPSSSWESNLRTALTDKEWDRLRKFCYQAAGNTCIACGSRGEPHVEAHEAWSFDEKTGIQKLKGLLCLCPSCHKIKHLGYSRRVGLYEQVKRKLLWLNDWTEGDFSKAIAAMQETQERLSALEWKLDITFLQKYGVR